jgi:DNA-binding protein YbaB
MIDDVLRSVTELTHRLRRAQTVLTTATAQARLVREGTDRTGSITVVIDDDGTARDVHVAADWRSRLDPADVGPAVVAADAEAAQRRAVATVQALAEAQALADDPATDRASEGTEWSSVDGQPPIGPAPDQATRAHSWLTPVPPVETGGRLRSLADLTAAVLAAADDLDEVTAPQPPVVGVGAEGAVRITVAHGRITECTVNQAWLARQDEVTLAHALREAISAAAAAALAARQPYIDYRQRLETLFADTQATLQDLSRGPR